MYAYLKQGVLGEITQQIRQIMTYNCEKIFIETPDLEGDKELNKMLECLETNDSVIVYHSSVFERNIRNYSELLTKFNSKNVELIIVDENVDTRVQKEYYAVVEKLAEMEHLVIKTKTSRGIEKAREEGRVGGRPKITNQMSDEIKFLRKSQHLSLREIAAMCGVSLGTVHKYVSEENYVS